MTLRRIFELTVLALALLIAAMALHAWLASRDEQQRLATTLAQQKHLLDAADTRERARQSTLAQTLAQIEKLKRATQTPQQIVNAIPQYISLPQPITFATNRQGTDASKTPGNANPNAVSAAQATQSPAGLSMVEISDSSLPSAPAAQIPSADLKPLFDYIQECRSCQAQLAAAKQNASDDASKLSALTKERDAAITAAKGGALWRRFRRNALWFAAGAAIASATAAATTHQAARTPR